MDASGLTHGVEHLQTVRSGSGGGHGVLRFHA
jgi:hypothetical protein